MQKGHAHWEAGLNWRSEKKHPGAESPGKEVSSNGDSGVWERCPDGSKQEPGLVKRSKG